MKSTINFMKDLVVAVVAIPELILDIFRIVLSDRTLTLFGSAAILRYAGCQEVAVTLLCDITTYSGIVDCIFLAKKLFIKDEGDELEEEFETAVHTAVMKLLTFAHDAERIFSIVRNWVREKIRKEETETETFNHVQGEAREEVRKMICTMLYRSMKIFWKRSNCYRAGLILASPLYGVAIAGIWLNIIDVGAFTMGWVNSCKEEFTEEELKFIFPDEELDLMERLCDLGMGTIPPMDLVV